MNLCYTSCFGVLFGFEVVAAAVCCDWLGASGWIYICLFVCWGLVLLVGLLYSGDCVVVVGWVCGYIQFLELLVPVGFTLCGAV